MRVNVYAEELPEEGSIEIIGKEIEGKVFTGLRIPLYLPVTLPDGTQARGKFMHSPDDDDSSAITIWGKRDLRMLLKEALAKLDKYYADKSMKATYEFATTGRYSAKKPTLEVEDNEVVNYPDGYYWAYIAGCFAQIVEIKDNVMCRIGSYDHYGLYNGKWINLKANKMLDVEKLVGPIQRVPPVEGKGERYV